MFGCDFIDNIPLQGWKKVMKHGEIFERHVNSNDKKKFFKKINRCPKDYYENFVAVCNLFIIVLYLIVKVEAEGCYDLFTNYQRMS